MKLFKDFIPTIQQKYISVFASGNSINFMTKEDLDFIKQKSFMITMNYAPVKLNGAMNVHSDKNVTDFLIPHFKINPKTMQLVSREAAFNNNIREHVDFKNYIDYWFDKNSDVLGGNYTVVWILILLTEHLPRDKTILLFGLDMKLDEKDIKEKMLKWYDKETKWDISRRGSYPAMEKLRESADQLTQLIKNKDMIINCNLDSGYDGFKKDNWKNYLS